MPTHRDENFCDLMRRVREGSEDAAWELVEKFGEPLRRAVRRALNRRLRPKFDSLDFVQLVWSSFFRLRRIDRFECPKQLAAFLITMARNKVGMEVRRYLGTEKCSVNRERSLDEADFRSRPDSSGRQPQPIEVAIAREQWERILRGQPKHYRKIVQLRLRGHTYKSIADSLSLDENTVRRFLKKLFRERVA